MFRNIIIATIVLATSSVIHAQSLDTTIVKNLKVGWNLIGYMGQTPETTMQAFASVMDKVVEIKTLDGFYNPEQQAYLNSLQNVNPLDGVMIKVSQSCKLERTIKKSAILYYDNEEDPVFVESPASQLTDSDVKNLRNQSGVNTGDQDLTNLVTKSELTNTSAQLRSEIPDVSGLASASDIPTSVSDLTNDAGYLTVEEDGSTTNEIQDLTLTGNILTITKNGKPTEIDLSKYLDNTDSQLSEQEVDDMVSDNGYLTQELDDDPTNEIQELSIVGHTVMLTDGGNVQIPQRFSGSYEDLKDLPVNLDIDNTDDVHLDTYQIITGKKEFTKDVTSTGLEINKSGVKTISFTDDETADVYDFEIHRYAGENGDVSILNNGTGWMTIGTNDAGSVAIKTANQPRIAIDPVGNVSFNRSRSVTGIRTPRDDNDAANKMYVDAEVDLLLKRIESLEIELGTYTFTDERDGNIYKTVKIGEQVWMAENLKYLPSVKPSAIYQTTDPVYYVYGYEGFDTTEAKATDNYNTYGVLYTWYAAMAGLPSSDSNPSNIKGACPEGWHLPSQSEWSELRVFLGGSESACNKIKEAGTIHWDSPNDNATNETGFTALPAGKVSTSFYNLGSYTCWHTSSESQNTVSIFNALGGLGAGSGPKDWGRSIRCVKD